MEFVKARNLDNALNARRTKVEMNFPAKEKNLMTGVWNVNTTHAKDVANIIHSQRKQFCQTIKIRMDSGLANLVGPRM